MDGGIAGGQIGYNWQSGNWVWGVEADIQWSGERGSADYHCAATVIGGVCLPGLTFLPPGVTGTSLALDQSLEWFGTAGCAAASLASPRVLLYATGGLAYGEIKTTATLAGVTPAGVALRRHGLEYRYPRWLDDRRRHRRHDHPELDRQARISLHGSRQLSIAGTFTPRTGRFRSTARVDFERSPDHILRAGINYKFGGPVVAKY